MRTHWFISALIATAALSLPAIAQRDERGSDETEVSLSFEDMLELTATVWYPPTVTESDPSAAIDQPLASVLLLGAGSIERADIRQDAALFDRPDDLLHSLGISVGRSTALRDGGIDSSNGSISSHPLAGYAEPNGEFDLYDISMNVGQLGDEALGLSLLTGFRAIRADVGKVSVSQDRAGNTTTTYREGQGIVAVPVVGAGMHWLPTDAVEFRGSATTHTISDATFFDLRAEAEIRLRYNVRFTTGYEFVHSAMEVRNVEAELSEAGLFARLQIKF